MTDKSLLQTALLALETRVWDALVTGDSSADDALLSDDFIGVYPDGFAGKVLMSGSWTVAARSRRIG